MGELTTPPHQPPDRELPDTDPYSDDVFLSDDAIYFRAINNTNSSQWNVIVTFGAHPVLFKVDTGAKMMALSEATYNLFHDPGSTATPDIPTHSLGN